MTKQVIAKIKLAPGEAGYFDEYSRIYLTIASPVAEVYSDTNCTQIKKSIKSGRLMLIEGSFSVPVDKAKNAPAKIKSAQDKEAKIKAEAQETEPKAEPIEESVPVQKTPEEEVKPRRKNRKNKLAETVIEPVNESEPVNDNIIAEETLDIITEA